MEKFWGSLRDNLPLYAAEGGYCTEIPIEDLAKKLQDTAGGNVSHPESMLLLVQDILDKAGVLDRICLDNGKWRFVSYPARLFACSLISLFMNEDGFFRRGFWAPVLNSSLIDQSYVLHSIETLRENTAQKSPIRRIFAALGVIKRGGYFIMRRRENQEDDPDNKLHGSYGFPGGRLNVEDLDASGANMTPEQKNAFLYGVPSRLTDGETSVIDNALPYTLTREIKEELGLKHGDHYTYSFRHKQSSTFIHGSNAHHCITEAHVTFFDIALTSAGDARLALQENSYRLFRLSDILSDNEGVFLNAPEESFKNYIKDAKDSADSIFIKSSQLPLAKSKQTDETAHIILPPGARGDVFLDDIKISLSDEQNKLLLLLGTFSRLEFKSQLQTNSVLKKRFGWLSLSDRLLRVARQINKDTAEYGPLLFIEGSMCRLRISRENIFLNPEMFYARITNSGIDLFRKSLNFQELFYMPEAHWLLGLSSANIDHLKNLATHDTQEFVSLDNLRHITGKNTAITLEGFAKKHGLFCLYEKDPDRKKGIFRFTIHVMQG
ncbi:hypothetical protein FACS1894187_01390 [Synergistales bacterium]|nr:hypothetical protein FACS1894187_01390 [Synergistales bacterium]